MEVLGFFLFIGLIIWIISLLAPKSNSQKKSQNISSYKNVETNPVYYSNMAWESFQKNDYLQAISYYTTAISYKKSSIYYNNRGHVKSILNDYQGALDDYNSAIQLSPQEGLYWFNRGMMFHNKGILKAALEDWEKASELGSIDAKEMLIASRKDGKAVKTSTYPNMNSDKKSDEEIIGKDLLDTKWRLSCQQQDLEDSDIEFQPNGVLIDSTRPKDKTMWIISGTIVSIIYGNGFCTYNGTISGNIYSGKATNKYGQQWTFRAELINKSEDIIVIIPSNQKMLQPSNKKKKLSNVTPSHIKRTNWTDFNKIFIENNISGLYHFTDKRNLKSIKEHGALYSWQYCETNNIDIPQAGGDELSRSLDRRHGVENYVRLSFTKNHPMMHLAQSQGRIGNSVILEIDPEVIFWQNTKFANKNAARNGVNIGSNLDDFKKIRFKIVKQQNHFNLAEEDKPFYQAEVLVFEKIPIKYIRNIKSL